MALQKWLRTAALATALALTPAKVSAKDNLDAKVQAAEVAKQKPKQKKPIIKDVQEMVPALLETIQLPDERKVTYSTKLWEYMLYIPSAYLLAMTLHESGHAAMFKAYGYKNIKVDLFKLEDGAVSTASAYYPYKGYKPNKLEDMVTSAGGIMFTSLANVGLTTMLRNNAVPEKMRPFVATLSLMMMFDRYYYVASSTAKYAFGKSSSTSDVHRIITTLNGSKRGNDIGYAVWFGLTALEIGLRYPEIKYLVHTAIGRKEILEKRYIQVHAYPIQSGGMLGVSGEF